MDNIELILTDISGYATKRLAEKKKAQGLKENIDIAKIGGSVAKIARNTLEENLGEAVITQNNKLNYKYIEEKQIEMESD